jgi:hypothetical protein
MRKVIRVIRVIRVFLSLVLITSCNNDAITISNGFSIEYVEGFSNNFKTKCLLNNVVFVRNVQEAHWNSNVLYVIGENGCFLIDLKSTEYPEDMALIPCDDFKNIILANGEIHHYYLKKD